MNAFVFLLNLSYCSGQSVGIAEGKATRYPVFRIQAVKALTSYFPLWNLTELAPKIQQLRGFLSSVALSVVLITPRSRVRPSQEPKKSLPRVARVVKNQYYKQSCDSCYRSIYLHLRHSTSSTHILQCLLLRIRNNNPRQRLHRLVAILCRLQCRCRQEPSRHKIRQI